MQGAGSLHAFQQSPFPPLCLCPPTVPARTRQRWSLTGWASSLAFTWSGDSRRPPLLLTGSRRKATFFLQSRAGQFGKASFPVPRPAPAGTPSLAQKHPLSPEPSREAPVGQGGRDQRRAPARAQAARGGTGVRGSRARGGSPAGRSAGRAGRGRVPGLGPGARQRAGSGLPRARGQAVEPRAADPGGREARRRAGGGGGGERGRPARATFRCDSFANLHDFNIKST